MEHRVLDIKNVYVIWGGCLVFCGGGLLHGSRPLAEAFRASELSAAASKVNGKMTHTHRRCTRIVSMDPVVCQSIRSPEDILDIHQHCAGKDSVLSSRCLATLNSESAEDASSISFTSFPVLTYPGCDVIPLLVYHTHYCRHLLMSTVSSLYLCYLGYPCAAS